MPTAGPPLSLLNSTRLSRGIQVLLAASSAAGRTVLSDEHTKDYAFFVSKVPLTGLESYLASVLPDVLLIDATDEEDRAWLLSLLRRMRRNYPALKSVLLVEESVHEFIVLAFQSGIRGIIPAMESTPQHVSKCVVSVHRGEFWIGTDTLASLLDAFSRAVLPTQWAGCDSLSPREKQVMDLVIQGLSNRDIAEILQVTESTVKKYVYEVFNKTGASNRVELVLRALRFQAAA
jgi:DNA-binding NarL/FixJ family response regulator